MKLCFLGKYPPIEGGVSTSNYWTARGLAQRGHKIHLVTNAFEVEKEYHMALRGSDDSWIEPRFEESGGYVKVYPTLGPGQSRLGHIPWSNPFVSKLASIAAQVIREHDCEVIYSFYLEPYSVAGYLASVWTGLPLVLTHAGSDLGHLMLNRNLSQTYQEIIQSAQAILTSEGKASRFVSIGADPSQIYPRPSLATQPRSVFGPEREDTDTQEIVSRAQKVTDDTNASTLDLSKPTIGIYGKVGETKGSFDLVRALGRLQKQEKEFNFLAMTQGHELGRFENAVRKQGIEGCTWLLPFIPNWRVPSFIRSCTAVCFLERDFPISIHGPRIAREVLACGSCLILSGEITNKQSYRASLSSGENLLIVEDPTAIDDLAETIRTVVEDPERANQIGKKGLDLASEFDEYENFVCDFEQIFFRVGDKKSSAHSFQEIWRNEAAKRPKRPHAPFQVFLSPSIPWPELFRTGQFEEAAKSFRQEHSDCSDFVDPVCTIQFLRFLESEIHTRQIVSESSLSKEIVRFERTLLKIKWGVDVEEPTGRLTTLEDCWNVNGKDIMRKEPVWAHATLVESFSHDMISFYKAGGGNALTDGGVEKSFQERVEQTESSEHVVIFQRLSNGRARMFKADATTQDIATQCNSGKGVEEVIKDVSESYGIPEEGKGELGERFLSILEKLLQQEIVALK